MKLGFDLPIEEGGQMNKLKLGLSDIHSGNAEEGDKIIGYFRQAVLGELENLYGGINSTPDGAVELWDEVIEEAMGAVTRLFGGEK